VAPAQTVCETEVTRIALSPGTRPSPPPQQRELRFVFPIGRCYNSLVAEASHPIRLTNQYKRRTLPTDTADGRGPPRRRTELRRPSPDPEIAGTPSWTMHRFEQSSLSGEPHVFRRSIRRHPVFPLLLAVAHLSRRARSITSGSRTPMYPWAQYRGERTSRSTDSTNAFRRSCASAKSL